MHTTASSSVIDLTRRPVWVTGAAGFVGFHLCRRLLADGHHVIGIDVVNSHYDPALKEARLAVLQESPDFALHRIDCGDYPAMDALATLTSPQTVFHMAAQAGVRYSLERPDTYIHSNLTAFGVLLEICRHHQVSHLVYASSSSVYGSTSRMPFDVHDPADHPVSLYAATKRANELMAHSYSHLFGLPTTGLRFFTVYGPWGRPDMAYFAFAEAIMAGRPLQLYGDGSAIRDFTYVDDIVEGVVRVAARPPVGAADWSSATPDPATSTAPFRLFNIGHGGQASVAELIALLESVIGREAVVERRPAAAGDVPRTQAVTTELELLTGFRPRIGLRDGIGRFVSWLLEYHAVPA